MTSPRQLPCSTGRLAGVRGWSTIIAVFVGSLAAGCGSAPPSEHEIAYARSLRPSTELATTPAEERALEQAPSLPSDEAMELEGQSVLASPIYTAASGRRCRELRFGAGARLACEALDADGWVFVPNVFTQPITTNGGAAPMSADGATESDLEPMPEAEEGSS